MKNTSDGVGAAITDEQIAALNQKQESEEWRRDSKTGYWAGCNYWVNQGQSEFEPVSTATSMHDCDACAKVGFCEDKKKAPIWRYNANTVKNA